MDAGRALLLKLVVEVGGGSLLRENHKRAQRAVQQVQGDVDLQRVCDPFVFVLHGNHEGLVSEQQVPEGLRGALSDGGPLLLDR